VWAGTVWAGTVWAGVAGMAGGDPAGPWPDWSRSGLPEIDDPKLWRILDRAYRAAHDDSVGDGSTADAVRYEIATGLRVAGREHVLKAQELIRALQKRIDNGRLTERDQETAEWARDHLDDALNTRGSVDAPDAQALAEQAGEAAAQVDQAAEEASSSEGIAGQAVDDLGSAARDAWDLFQAGGDDFGPFL